MQSLLYLVVVASATGVAVDASRLSAKRGALGGGLLDMGPAGWFFATLLVWIVGLPCYLATRPKLARRAQVLAMHPQFAGVTYGQQPHRTDGQVSAHQLSSASPHPASPLSVASQGPAGAPPGYYPNPDGPFLRWWDGSSWAPDDH